MKMKVLSPAGDFESLKAAVYNGADEVYLGVKDFNARNIEAFNLNTLQEAVKFAHIYGVRVFLTVNILFTDEEMQSAVDLIVDAYNIGVDAFIIQDIGLADIIHNNYPMIEMHASTQMAIHNLEGVKAIERFGFKRVVLSRETPLSEVKRIRDNSDIEIEYFVQGALCVSFSGNCYLSSYMFDASGNRGKCKQLCRLPYKFMNGDELVKEGYLLSAKDICMIDRLKELEDAGVTSLKIEGRARRPYYVAVATREYRRAVDGLTNNYEELELSYNRGFTPAYLDGNSGIISRLQNHVGIEIGKVCDFKKGNKFNTIYISTNREISPKSSLKFFREGTEITTISAFDLTKVNNGYKVTTTQIVEKGDGVNIISDYNMEQNALSVKKKVDISLNISAKIGMPIVAQVDIRNRSFVVTGENCVESKTSSLTLDELVNNFNKSEYFNPRITADLDQVFMPKSVLNEFRRQVYSQAERVLTEMNRMSLEKIILPDVIKREEMTDYQIVNEYVDSSASKIIYSPENYQVAEIVKIKEKYESLGKQFILNLPNFALLQDIKLLSEIVKKTKVDIMINNLYALEFDTNKYIGAGMNVYNSYTANVYNLPYIKAELGQGVMPYMTLRHCPMKEHMCASCDNCPYKDGFKYIMPKGKELNLKRVKMSTCTFYLV